MTTATPGARSAVRRPSLLALPAGVIAAWLSVASCGDGGRQPASEARPAGTPVAVGDEPRLSVGVARGDTAEQFHDVTAPFLLPDGRMAVPLTGRGLIRLFSPGGEAMETLGGKGEGPGEFRRLDTAWHRGDTIEAWDPRLGRLTRFYPEQEPDVVTVANVATQAMGIAGPLPGGWAVAGFASAGMVRRDSTVVHVFDLDGRHRGEVVRVGGMHRMQTGDAGGARTPSPPAPSSPWAAAGSTWRRR